MKAAYLELGATTHQCGNASVHSCCTCIPTGKLHNIGHNCLAAEVLVTDAAWPQREQFLDVLQRKASALAQVSLGLLCMFPVCMCPVCSTLKGIRTC